MEFVNIYGAPPPDLVEVSATAMQFSPLVPGAADLAALPEASLESLAMLAPPGTLERRYALAQALRRLAPGAPFMALAPKDKGGARIAGDLTALGCPYLETARRHHRLCVAKGGGDPAAIATLIEEGGPRFLQNLGLWSQPGVFSWDRIDPGSAALLHHLPALSGAGADFGCGIGALARDVLRSSSVVSLALLDIDRRAIDMAKRNIVDPRARFQWADVLKADTLAGLDFVVMNPPFHEGGVENQALGQSFIRRAAASLRTGGVCWLTANRHLPYEAILKPLFRHASVVAETNGYKIFQARK